MKPLLSAFALGLLFSLGLGWSGMARPDVVLAFLDVTGSWNPALIAVMAGAIGVTLPAFQWLFRRKQPLFASHFTLPTQTRPSPRLCAGSVLFGIGWGLSGYCPGAALVAVASGAAEPVVFSLTMLAGFYLYKRGNAPVACEQPERETP